MPNFHRFFAPGASFFFTVVTYERRPLFRDPLARRILREAIETVRRRRPFELLAIVLLPDHLHCLWKLPPKDGDFSTRWLKIKETVTREYLAGGGTDRAISAGQRRKGLRGVWQPRFWEHTIRDEDDFGQHVDYIHYNPVKHGLSTCAHSWPWSTFEAWSRRGVYERDWCCFCRRPDGPRPDFPTIPDVGE
jgi:putative transposase